MQVRKQQWKPDMGQQIASKLGKEYVKAPCCHPAYLTYMQSESCEMPGWMKFKLESRLLKEVYQGCICHPTYLTCVQHMSYEMPSWMKLKLESRLLGEISVSSDMQVTPP